MPAVSNICIFTFILALGYCGQTRPSDDSVTLFM
jgi:hypothetical protein